MRPLAGLACLAVASALTVGPAAPVAAGGAWARGKGHVFASLAWSIYGDILGYLDAIETAVDEVPALTFNRTLATYAEVGLTDHLTAGLDRHSAPAEDTGSTIFFLRANYQPARWRSSFGVQFGLGSYRDWRQIDEQVVQLGLSWGMGFATRWMDGWADIEAKGSRASETGSTFWKIDSTFGVEPTDRMLAYLQMQSGALGDYPAYTRAVPTVVYRFGDHISVESAALLGLVNDKAQGLRLGLWLEF